MKSFSYAAERTYYEKSWPKEVRPSTPYTPYLKAIFQDLRVLRDRRILDVGAGECLHSQLMAQDYAFQLVVAMDLFAQRMIPMARQTGNGRLRFVAGDCHQLPFSDKSFDIVYGFGILHHLPQLEGPVREIFRVLKPGGSYYGMEPNFYCPLSFFRQLFDHRSENECFLPPEKTMSVFRENGFASSIRYFWARFPKLKNRFLTTCFAIRSVKLSSQLIDPSHD